MAHKRICHQWSERRAHGNLIHLPVKISVELEKVFFYVFFVFLFFVMLRAYFLFRQLPSNAFSAKILSFVGLCFLVNAE